MFNAAPVEIKGKTIGVVERGYYLRFLKKTYGDIIKVRIFSDREKAFAALNDGSVDAVIDDSMVIKNWRLLQRDDKKYRSINLPAKHSALVWHSYGIAVTKSNTQLLKILNDAIKQIKTDGTLAKLIKKYFAE
jgi:ABC-type amino acid transport substrate-binding protein